MFAKKLFFKILLILFFSSAAFGKGAIFKSIEKYKYQKKNVVDFNVKDGQLFINDKANPRHIVIDKISNMESFTIRLKAPTEIKFEEDKKPEEIKEEAKNLEEKEHEPDAKEEDAKEELKEDVKKESESDPSLLSKYLFDANEYYHDHNVKKAWGSINKAEKIAPNDFRVKTMKGSILYVTGDKVSAKKYWQESLKINPNQPEVQTQMNKIDE